LFFKHYGKAGGYLKKRYFSLKSICKNCSKQKSCAGSNGVKKIEHTIYREEYEEMIKRLKSEKGKKSYALRMQTVEPVFGTLQQHYGLRWINARGKECAHKIMLMAGTAVNLKKWIKKATLNEFLMAFKTIFKSRLSVMKENYILVREILHQEYDPLCVMLRDAGV
jgi:hypothetical protein